MAMVMVGVALVVVVKMFSFFSDVFGDGEGCGGSGYCYRGD